MSGCYNRVVLVGRLGQDVELRYVGNNNTAVADLSVATERRIKKGDRWEEVPVWVRCVVWGRRAETAQQYLSKGSKVLVEGELELNKWKDRDGNERQQLRVIVNNLVFMDSKGSGGSGGGGGGGGGGYGNGGGGGGQPDFTDDDIPF